MVLTLCVNRMREKSLNINDMKNLLIAGLLLIIAGWACSPQKESTSSASPAANVLIDSTEYEITIIDPYFDRWYLMNYSPSRDRSNGFYRSMNNIGVSNWNDYFNRGRYSHVIGSYLHYNPSVDYGIEVNRRLYWYFRFLEENYRVRLLR